MGLLGATAAEQFLGKSGSTKLSDQVGRPISLASRPGLRVVPLYHPAFILRNPRLRGLMVEHLRKLRAAV
jgi:uracil-DNA glycosylase